MAIRTDWLGNEDLTGRSWFSVMEEVNSKFGPEAVRQLLDANFFEQFPGFSAGDRAKSWDYVGSNIARAQADADKGLDPAKLGLGFLGVGGVGGLTGSALATGQDPRQAALLDAAALAAANPLAAGTAALGGSGAGAGVLAGAGDMFGSGAVWEAGTGALAAGGAGSGAALAGAGDMFGSGAVYEAGAAGLGAPAAAAAPVAGAVAQPGAVAAPVAAGAGAGSFLSNPAVLGAAGGALLGSGVLGGGTQAGTIQVEEGIPDWLMPYVKPQLDQYSTQLQNYQTDPYGIMPSAMKEFQNTVSGMYLDPSTNKYLEDYFRMGSERVKSSLSPTFGHMQAFGAHSGYNEALSKGLGDFATGLYGGAYEKERDRQAQFTAASPQFLAQNTAQQFAPYQNYLSTVGQLGKKKQEPYFENPMGNLFGGAMAGAGLGSLWK